MKRPPAVEGAWVVLGADAESVTFRSPEGNQYQALCVAGRFDLEAQHAFGQLWGKKIEPGAIHGIKWATYQHPDGEGRWSISFPERMAFGAAQTDTKLRGFRLESPLRKRIDCYFVSRLAPIELAEVLTALFRAPGEENGDGTGQLRQEPLPGEGGAADGAEDGPEGLQGVEEHRGSAEGRRRRAPRVVLEVGDDVPRLPAPTAKKHPAGDATGAPPP